MYQVRTYGGMSSLLSEGFSQVQELSGSWGQPLSEQIEAAWTLQVDYVARLLEAVSMGNRRAIREREDYLLGNRRFQGNTRAQELLQEAHVHSTSDFINLTAAVANRRLVSLYNQRSKKSHFNLYVQMMPDRATCDEMGTISIFPVASGSQSGNPLLEGGSFTYWRFTESLRGKYGVTLHADAFAWTWKLAMCDKYGGLSDVLPWLVRIQNERKEMLITQSYVGKKGPHPDVYNAKFNNLIPGNPRIGYAVFKIIFSYISLQVDSDKELITARSRTWVLVVGSDLLAEYAKGLLAAYEVRLKEKNEKNEEVELITKVTLPKLEVVYNQYIRNVATEPHPRGGIYADHMWALFPKPETGEKNPIELAHLQGFRQSRLFRKAGNTATLGGEIIPGLGDFHTMDQETKAVQSYGVGVMWPEWTFASDGTGDVSVLLELLGLTKDDVDP